jgi:apolipoprotein D and lipocalin family protein
VGENTRYAWILARDTSLPPETLDGIVQRAKALGIDTHAFIWVSHTHADPTGRP